MSVRSARQHYKKFLSKHYSWMFGGFDQEIEKNQRWFVDQNIHPQTSRKAIDFGCGSGFQSLALSSLGFKVTAVDFDRYLLEELKTHDQKGKIEIVQSDISSPENYLDKGPFELAVCMGDTLTHLPSIKAISDFFLSVCEILQPLGKFILTFRDYTDELTGTDRFMPVHNNDKKIMTVFLEYKTDHVLVHDLVYEKNKAIWDFKKSMYKKIRLSPAAVIELIKEVNLHICYHRTEQGFVQIMAQKL